jgi:hypothetical protein
VFEDPTPPTFENLRSAFRCYVVPTGAHTNQSATAG